MNILSGIGVVIFLLETGGPQAVDDARIVTNIVQALQSGQAPTSVLTTANLDAATRLLKIVAKGLQNDSTRGEIVTFLNSLA